MLDRAFGRFGSAKPADSSCPLPSSSPGRDRLVATTHSMRRRPIRPGSRSERRPDRGGGAGPREIFYDRLRRSLGESCFPGRPRSPGIVDSGEFPVAGRHGGKPWSWAQAWPERRPPRAPPFSRKPRSSPEQGSPSPNGQPGAVPGAARASSFSGTRCLVSSSTGLLR
jgi:hypothetical protein